MKPLRVLYLDHTAELGGGEIALGNLIRCLDRDFVEPVVLLFSDGPLVQRLAPMTTLHIIALNPSVVKATKDALGWRSLLKVASIVRLVFHLVRVTRFVQKADADVIHTNSLKADIIGGIVGKLTRTPVIWHVRDRIDFDYLPKPVVRLFRLLARRIPNYIIANSEATLSTLSLDGKQLGTAIPSGVEPRLQLTAVHDSCQVVHDGCQIRPSRNPTGTAQDYVRIGLVGRISPWKGQDIFLKAAALVLESHPGTQFEIIGSAMFADRDYEIRLHEFCRALGMEGAVEFAGFIEDVQARIAELDILVHASVTGEPFGQVIVEGMAEGKPIIATNGGGVPEIVLDGVTGMLVPMGDADAMAQAIRTLLDDPAKAAQMGRLGRERVQQRFTVHRTARMVEAVYRQLLSIS